MPPRWSDIKYVRIPASDDSAALVSPILSLSMGDSRVGPNPPQPNDRFPLSPVALSAPPVMGDADTGVNTHDSHTRFPLTPLSPILEDNSTIRSFDKKDDPAETYSSIDGPPPLCYPIETKKASIALTWFIIILVNSVLPITIFYVMRFVAHSDKDLILNIAQIPMTPTLFQFPYRLWQLKRRGGERSPRNRGRFTWDFFQWQFFFGALLTTAVCVVAGVLDSYRVFALAAPILFSEVCLQLLLFDFLSTLKIRQPCRISSVPRGAPFRPGAFYIIEDLTAVDGAGGAAYRDRLCARWDASPPFRRLVRDISRILGFSGLLMVGVEIALIFMTPANFYFGGSWLILWAWAGLSAFFCISYTKSCLKVEKDWWQVNNMGAEGV